MSPTRPRVIRVRTAERPGGTEPSEDRVFLTPNAAIVLDGASQPEATDHNGGWLAENLGQRIYASLIRDPDVNLTKVVTDAIAAVAAKHSLVPGTSPSSTIAIARWNNSTLETYVLGDSPVIALTTTGQIHQVRDDRITSTSSEVNDSSLSGFRFDDRDVWQALVNDQRHRRNQPHGYWIAEADPTAAAHAFTDRWQLAELSAVLLMTDGVSRGIDQYQQPADWHTAFTRASTDPTALLDTVQAAELSDPYGHRWQRSKAHDDKTAVLIEWLNR